MSNYNIAWNTILFKLWDIIVEQMPSTQTKIDTSEHINTFLNLGLQSFSAGEADAINETFQRNLFNRSEFFNPKMLQKPAEQTLLAINKIFKAKNFDTINENEFKKLQKIYKGEFDQTFDVMNEKAQSLLKEHLQAKISKAEAKVKMMEEGFSHGYAENVMRTNLNNGYNAGKYNRAMKSEFIDGFRYVSNSDSRTRENHKACDGLEQHKDSKWWDYLYPPLGYNCRCLVVMVMAGTLKEHVPSGLSYPPLKRTSSKGYADYSSFGKARINV